MSPRAAPLAQRRDIGAPTAERREATTPHAERREASVPHAERREAAASAAPASAPATADRAHARHGETAPSADADTDPRRRSEGRSEEPRERTAPRRPRRGARARRRAFERERAAERHAMALSPRRRREEARALRHTRRVRRLRVALPVLSAVIALVLVGAAALPKMLPLSALSGLSLTADGLVMNEPRLAGSLGEGRRYEVVAERAVQSLLTPARLSLEGLSASLDMGEDANVTIRGTRAAYNTDTEVLRLSGGVEIASSDGNRARLEDATVSFGEGTVASSEPVTITSPRGTIEAGAIDIVEGGALMRLYDGVSITIHPATR